MPELEAEQVVGEEEEAPPKKRGPGLLSKGVIIVCAIVIVEAVVLLVVFDKIRGGGGEEEPAEQTAKAEAPGLESYLADQRAIDVGDVSINEPSKERTRQWVRTTINVRVFIDAESYTLIMQASELYESAVETVKGGLREHIRNFMLRQTGNKLMSTEMQAELPEKLTKYLNEFFSPLRDHILGVDIVQHRQSMR
ncbi:MAG: hypothetical protein ACE5GW_00600 [Planctomycetota bacterium]